MLAKFARLHAPPPVSPWLRLVRAKIRGFLQAKGKGIKGSKMRNTFQSPGILCGSPGIHCASPLIYPGLPGIHPALL